jgi:hypothetical protein
LFCFYLGTSHPFKEWDESRLRFVAAPPNKYVFLRSNLCSHCSLNTSLVKYIPYETNTSLVKYILMKLNNKNMIKPTILAIKILSIKLFSLFFGSSTNLNKLFYTCIWEAKNLIISIWLMLIWRICFFF